MHAVYTSKNGYAPTEACNQTTNTTDEQHFRNPPRYAYPIFFYSFYRSCRFLHLILIQFYLIFCFGFSTISVRLTLSGLAVANAFQRNEFRLPKCNGKRDCVQNLWDRGRKLILRNASIASVYKKDVQRKMLYLKLMKRNVVFHISTVETLSRNFAETTKSEGREREKETEMICEV